MYLHVDHHSTAGIAYESARNSFVITTVRECMSIVTLEYL